MRCRAALALLGAATVASCGTASHGVGESARRLVEALPATYAGTLPCDDCPGVDFTLVLRRDNIYLLRTHYHRPGSEPIDGFDELGTWGLAADSMAILMTNRPGDIEARVVIADDSTLVVPPPGAREVTDTTSRTLRRLSPRPPFVARLQLRGMLHGGQFTECRTGLTLPVERMPAGARALLDSSRRARTLADIEATVSPSRVGEGASDAQALLITSLVRVLPGDTCVTTTPTTINRITWQLASEHGRLVSAADAVRPPYLFIDEEGTRVSGMSGCNQFGGTVTVGASTIRFRDIFMTKMACERMELESRFIAALEEARTWRIVDNQLELADEAGAVVAQFVVASSRR
jgi:copper homeostasis protein (lipoprotein)